MKQSTRLKNIDRTNHHDISARGKSVRSFTPAAASTSSVISTDVIIVGAGASGLMCAANLKTGGLILESSSRVGTKLLMSGHGHCNITHAGSIKNFPSAMVMLEKQSARFCINIAIPTWFHSLILEESKP